jgi:hypothetical protein
LHKGLQENTNVRKKVFVTFSPTYLKKHLN